MFAKPMFPVSPVETSWLVDSISALAAIVGMQFTADDKKLRELTQSPTQTDDKRSGAAYSSGSESFDDRGGSL